MSDMDNTRRFVEWDVPALDTLQECKAYQSRDKLNKGMKLNRSDKNWLTEAINHNTYSRRGIPVVGWLFDFTDTVHLYWVRQYGRITEYYATDKTALRNILIGKVDKIVELI